METDDDDDFHDDDAMTAVFLLFGENDATSTTETVMDAVNARNADAPILMAFN